MNVYFFGEFVPATRCLLEAVARKRGYLIGEKGGIVLMTTYSSNLPMAPEAVNCGQWLVALSSISMEAAVLHDWFTAGVNDVHYTPYSEDAARAMFAEIESDLSCQVPISLDSMSL